MSFLFSFLNAGSQSIYTFRYNFNSQQDSTTYHAFLVRNDDGSGLLRIRYNSHKGAEDVLVEAYTDEQNPPDPSGEPDTSLLLIRAVTPSFIQADGKPAFTVPAFIFRLNRQSDFFEPAAVTTEASSSWSMSPGAHFSWKFLEGAALEKKVVAQFFSEDDEFFTNLFRSTTRGLSAAEKKIRMHLLIVADTLDRKIGMSAVLDIRKITETFGSLCGYLGITLLTDIVYGKNFSKTGLQQSLAKLRPASTDIVVFYYTGHGFRIPERPRKYPNMKLKNFVVPRPAVFRNPIDSMAWIKKEREANIANTMNIEDIFNSIRKKGGRLNLVVSDCCNDDIFSSNIEGKKPASTKGSGIEWDEENIRSLFLNKAPLSILASATEEGQRAASKRDFGGFFTEFFKRSLVSHCSKLRANVTWDLVLMQAKVQTAVKAKSTFCANPKIPENACKQDPVSVIKPGK